MSGKVSHIKILALLSLDGLSYIGRRRMGVLEFIPPVKEIEKSFKVRIVNLYKFVCFTLNEAGDSKVEMQLELF